MLPCYRSLIKLENRRIDTPRPSFHKCLIRPIYWALRKTFLRFVPYSLKCSRCWKEFLQLISPAIPTIIFSWCSSEADYDPLDLGASDGSKPFSARYISRSACTYIVWNGSYLLWILSCISLNGTSNDVSLGYLHNLVCIFQLCRWSRSLPLGSHLHLWRSYLMTTYILARDGPFLILGEGRSVSRCWNSKSRSSNSTLAVLNSCCLQFPLNQWYM